MKNILLFVFVLFCYNGYSQTDSIWKFQTYSEKYIQQHLKSPDGKPGGTSKWVSYTNYLKGFQFPDYDLPAGNYRFYLKVDDNCKLYFDEKSRITSSETNIKFDLKKSEIEAINKFLSRIKTAHYHDDILVPDCKNTLFRFPVTVSY